MAEANKVVPLKPRAKKAAPKKTTAKKAVTKKTAAKATAKKAAPKKTAAKKTTAKTAPKKTVKKAPAKKVVAKKAAPKKVVAKKATPKKAASKKVVAKKTVTAKKPAKKAAPKVAVKKRAAQPAIKVPEFKTFNPQTMKTENIMTQGQAQFDQFTKDAANLNREGIDAFVKSSTIFAKGFETIIRESLSFAQTSAEKQMQLAKDALTSKTINEFSDAQNKIAQTGFDDFMSGATKISELSAKVLTEAIEPINDQIAKSVQKATETVAAE